MNAKYESRHSLGMKGHYYPLGDGMGIVGYSYKCPKCHYEKQFRSCDDGCDKCGFSEPYVDEDDWYEAHTKNKIK